MPTIEPPTELFTRAQIGEITGINDSTLNYWMREAVLRPAAGGEGRGSHRRFDYRMVNLAAILQELRGFGIQTPSLARIAGHFHDALDWMADRCIYRSNVSRVWDLLMIRRKIVKEGVWSWQISSDEELGWFANHQSEPDQYGHKWVDLDWEDAIAYWFRPRPHRSHETPPTRAEIDMVGAWENSDIAQFNRMELYSSAISEIFAHPAEERGRANNYFFHRDGSGEWQLSCAAQFERHAASFIGIDIEFLTSELWSSVLAECRKPETSRS